MKRDFISKCLSWGFFYCEKTSLGWILSVAKDALDLLIPPSCLHLLYPGISVPPHLGVCLCVCTHLYVCLFMCGGGYLGTRACTGPHSSTLFETGVPLVSQTSWPISFWRVSYLHSPSPTDVCAAVSGFSEGSGDLTSSCQACIGTQQAISPALSHLNHSGQGPKVDSDCSAAISVNPQNLDYSVSSPVPLNTKSPFSMIQLLEATTLLSVSMNPTALEVLFEETCTLLHMMCLVVICTSFVENCLFEPFVWVLNHLFHCS